MQIITKRHTYWVITTEIPETGTYTATVKVKVSEKRFEPIAFPVGVNHKDLHQKIDSNIRAYEEL